MSDTQSIQIDKAVALRRFCEAPFGLTYGLTLIALSILSVLGLYWIAIAEPIWILYRGLDEISSSIGEGIMWRLLINPESVLSSDDLDEESIRGRLHYLFSVLPYLYLLAPFFVPAATAAMLIAARSAWDAMTTSRVLLPLLITITGLPYFLASNVLAFPASFVWGTLFSLPAVSFSFIQEQPVIFTWLGGYIPVACGVLLLAWCILALILITIFKTDQVKRRTFAFLKRGSRFQIKNLHFSDWRHLVFHLVKTLAISPLRVVFSWSFAVFLICSTLAHIIDDPMRPARRLERDFEDVLPFAIVTGICALFVFRRAIIIAMRIIKDTEFLLRTLRQRSASTAAVVMERDPRGPVLFLRSFADDETVVPDLAPLPSLILNGVYVRRLEEIIADIAWYYGPLIAFNDPKADIAPLGAAKNTILGESWTDEILKYISSASAIVVVLGSGRSLSWEISQIESHGQLWKTVFLVPPHDGLQTSVLHLHPTLQRWISQRSVGAGVPIALNGEGGASARLIEVSRRDGRAYAEAAETLFNLVTSDTPQRAELSAV